VETLELGGRVGHGPRYGTCATNDVSGRVAWSVVSFPYPVTGYYLLRRVFLLRPSPRAALGYVLPPPLPDQEEPSLYDFPLG